jgi:hypothetical protein
MGKRTNTKRLRAFWLMQNGYNWFRQLAAMWFSINWDIETRDLKVREEL